MLVLVRFDVRCGPWGLANGRLQGSRGILDGLQAGHMAVRRGRLLQRPLRRVIGSAMRRFNCRAVRLSRAEAGEVQRGAGCTAGVASSAAAVSAPLGQPSITHRRNPDTTIVADAVKMQMPCLMRHARV